MSDVTKEQQDIKVNVYVNGSTRYRVMVMVSFSVNGAVSDLTIGTGYTLPLMMMRDLFILLRDRRIPDRNVAVRMDYSGGDLAEGTSRALLETAILLTPTAPPNRLFIRRGTQPEVEPSTSWQQDMYTEATDEQRAEAQTIIDAATDSAPTDSTSAGVEQIAGIPNTWKVATEALNGLRLATEAELAAKPAAATDSQLVAAHQQVYGPGGRPTAGTLHEVIDKHLPPAPKSAPEFLQRSKDLLDERGKQYDQEGGERSMGKAVAAFNTITGHKLSESEGWLLLQLLKDVRQWSTKTFHRDSAEDCVAYSALKAEALVREGE